MTVVVLKRFTRNTTQPSKNRSALLCYGTQSMTVAHTTTSVCLFSVGTIQSTRNPTSLWCAVAPLATWCAVVKTGAVSTMYINGLANIWATVCCNNNSPQLDDNDPHIHCSSDQTNGEYNVVNFLLWFSFNCVWISINKINWKRSYT